MRAQPGEQGAGGGGRPLNAAPASASGFWFDGQNNETRRCLDDSFVYGLRTWRCNEMDFQYWYGVYAS